MPRELWHGPGLSLRLKVLGHQHGVVTSSKDRPFLHADDLLTSLTVKNRDSPICGERQRHPSVSEIDLEALCALVVHRDVDGSLLDRDHPQYPEAS